MPLTSAMDSNYGHKRGESGQALLLGLATVTVIFAIAAIVVDLGLWLTERRGAQTDADLASLAGAWELLNPSGNKVTAAQGAAQGTLAANDEQGNNSLAGPITVDSACFGNPGRPDAVNIDVNHGSPALFSGIFGALDPSVGAHARACAGGTNAPKNLLPLMVGSDNGSCFNNNGTARFDFLCPLDFSGAQIPLLDLERRNSVSTCSDTSTQDDVQDLIGLGNTGICLINDSGSCSGARNANYCVGFSAGVDSEDVFDGLEQRIRSSTECDELLSPLGVGDESGVDDFREAVEPVFGSDIFTAMNTARDCEPNRPGIQISPRLVSIVVLDQQPSNLGNGEYPITAFAGFFITGCDDEVRQNVLDADHDLDRDCDGEADDGSGNEIEHLVIYGRLVNIIVEGSDVGPPTASTTLFSVALKE